MKTKELNIGAIKRIIAYLLLAVSLYFSLDKLSSCIIQHCHEEYEEYWPRILDALVLALPILWCRRKSIVLGWIILVQLYLLSILWYFRTYAVIMPLTSYLMVQNLDGLPAYIYGSLKLKDGLILLPVLPFVVIYLRWLANSGHLPVKRRYLWMWMLLLTIQIALPYYSQQPQKAEDMPLKFFRWEPGRSFRKFGLVNFWIYQLHQLRGVSKEERKEALQFMDTYWKKQTWPLKNNINSHTEYVHAGGKNLILILVESLQTWPIGMKYQGIEITPGINRLIEQENSCYFPHVLPQVKDGRSSDAQLLINTGLLPLLSGATSSLCNANVFPSLPYALKQKGYWCASLLCDERDFWNQAATSQAYGFDSLYDDVDEGRNKMEADEYFFQNALPILKTLPQPFYAQLVTFSTHMPYDVPQIEECELNKTEFANKEVRNYLIALQLLDYRLTAFIDELKAAGLYDNSLIVITGDHEQETYNLFEGRPERKAEDTTVPFLVLNAPTVSPHTNQYVSQVDLYPSLLYLMGCYTDYPFKGLGDNLWADRISNLSYTSLTPTPVISGKVTDEARNYRQQIQRISDILLRMDYFRQINKFTKH